MEKPHKKLEAWRKAMDLTVAVYHATGDFPKDHLFQLSQQLRRAALRVASNIAEGTARQTKLEVATRLGLLHDAQWTALNAQMNHIDKLLSGLIRHVKSGTSPRSTLHSLPLTLHRSS